MSQNKELWYERERKGRILRKSFKIVHFPQSELEERPYSMLIAPATM